MQPFELQIKVTTEYVDIDDATTGHSPRQRMLLYKHDDDLRQEMFAVEFVRTCDALLKASGLDLRLLTFECVPVGEQRGFVEWIPGSVPLSELCRSPLSDSEDKGSEKKDVASVEQSLSEVARAGFSKYQPLRRPRRAARSGRLSSDNAIQDFLRSVAYDPNEQYLIQKEIMDTYIKSCAGYCVISYVLGVGDRHLDNLLLHQTGHFFHCDFSFLLGRDPKQYLPMRITEAMVEGMGGKESDGYAMFLSLAGAAFCVLRRHENVRVMLALVRTLASANLPDVSVQQTVDQATQSMMDRLRLDLSDADAITFIEETIETSISSKMWLAVDAMHSIGKRL
jgi:phosphatidylinositol kinase/protein kinase (PI-3  family)